MKILLLAPQPYYQARGTPIAVDLLVRVLVEQGHSVDILTYHEGEDRDHGEKARILRIPPPPVCRNIRPGFSWKKLLADAYLYREAMRLAQDGSYDVVHAVEESVFMARRIKKRFGLPYVFDMDSSMPAQLADAIPLLRLLLPPLRGLERLAVRDATAVAAVCDSLADMARNAGARQVFLLRDVPLTAPEESGRAAPGFRDSLKIEGLCCLVYIGNLERYQGIRLMLDAFARVPGPTRTGARLVVVGGTEKHLQRYRRRARTLGIAGHTHFLGPRPVSDLPALMAEADILLSPRIQGQNTPMKVYSYMASGRAILATDLPTHTQVLSSRCAQLAAPRPQAFAQGMEALIGDPARRARLGCAAREKVEHRYSLSVFKRAVADLYAYVGKERGCRG